MKSGYSLVAILAGILTVFCPDNSCAKESRPNFASERYVLNQAFDRRAFFKDNNVWVYTPKFAETFGMPPEGSYAGLKGIDAAAFRIEDTNYKMCGMGGKAENCHEQKRCITDIYIDEARYPLPWASPQRADWLNDYNSLLWLQLPAAPKTAEETAIDREEGVKVYKPNVGGRSGDIVNPGVIPNMVVNMGTYTLRPFADPETHREANWYHNANNPQRDDRAVSSVEMVYGYKRQAIAGLTMISLGYQCMSRNPEKKDVIFRLETRKTIGGPTLRRFHEFEIPDLFHKKIDQALKEKTDRDIKYYKELLKSKQ